MGVCCGGEDASSTPSGQNRPKKQGQFPEPTPMELATTTDEELMDKYLDIVQGIIDKGEPFIDKDFPPCASSIHRPEDGRNDRFDSIEWTRASAIYRAPEVF